MSDLSLPWGGDLAASASGDLLTVSGSDYTTQRVLRRLLTSPGDYLWHPEYGAGLGQFIGQPTAAATIEAVIRQQMALEADVVQSPEPMINIATQPDGTVTTAIQYASAGGGTAQLSFSVSA